MTDTAIEPLPEQAETPPPEPEPQPQAQGDGDPAPLDVSDDAAVDAALEHATIKVPGDDGLVPMSETGRMARAYRQQIKDLKGELANAKDGSARAAGLEQRITQLETQLQQTQPYVQAYQAMQQAAQQTAPNAEEDAEAEEYARLLDLYTADGKPDIVRAKKGLALVQRLADKSAQQQVAPLQQQTVGQQSAYNLARAKNTVLPNGAKADPAMLDMIWQRLDPSITASPEGAKQALIAAVGYSQLVAPAAQPQQPTQRAPNGQFTGQQPPAPLFTEKAGGKADANNLPFSKHELDYMKASGMSEKDYLASTPPWMRRQS